MAHADRERWDRRYAAPGVQLRKGPNGLLLRHVPPAPPGARALELACGLGQNALWLAEQGYRVDALDISLQGLRRARAEMLRRQISGVNFIVADLDYFPLPTARYDLVIVFRFLDRRLFPPIRACVRPGGWVIYQTFNVRQLERMPDCSSDHVLQLGELPRYFPGWIMVEAGDDDTSSSLVAQKPE